jgi:peroxiredoxin
MRASSLTIAAASVILLLVAARHAGADGTSSPAPSAQPTTPDAPASPAPRAEAAPQRPMQRDVTSEPLAIGQPIPLADVKMKSAAGKPISIADAAGKKGTLVIFTCNHCPWVKAWQGRTTALGNAAVGKGIGVIAINSNDPEQFPEDAFEPMVTRAKELGIKFPYVMDATSDVGRAFGATRTPEAFLFDADGKLVYHGTVDDNARHEDQVTQRWLADAVDAVAAGKTVPISETKAMGCGIKLRARHTI